MASGRNIQVLHRVHYMCSSRSGCRLISVSSWSILNRNDCRKCANHKCTVQCIVLYMYRYSTVRVQEKWWHTAAIGAESGGCCGDCRERGEFALRKAKQSAHQRVSIRVCRTQVECAEATSVRTQAQLAIEKCPRVWLHVRYVRSSCNLLLERRVRRVQVLVQRADCLPHKLWGARWERLLDCRLPLSRLHIYAHQIQTNTQKQKTNKQTITHTYSNQSINTSIFYSPPISHALWEMESHIILSSQMCCRIKLTYTCCLCCKDYF